MPVNPMPVNPMPVNLWTRTDHALDYLGRADSIAHRTEGESSLLEFVPRTTRRILDLGTGDGRLLALVKRERPNTEAIAIDFSPAMLEAARKRFAGDSSVAVMTHNLDDPLPDMGKFDAVVSSFAIHHVTHPRKRALYSEIHERLSSGGVFCNLEHVASPTPRLHEEFLRQIGLTPETEDASNQLLDVETQLQWLREIGFADVDCHGNGGNWRCWRGDGGSSESAARDSLGHPLARLSRP
jgi:SAM-dependent methyltransferase